VKSVEIIERIEGEARLNLSWKEGVIDDAKMEFLNFRGFEYILEGKHALDALVLTPRVCGICGHSHLIASLKALEDAYQNGGYTLEISNKAKIIRELALGIELIQNHIKWYYMFLMPDVTSEYAHARRKNLYEPIKGQSWSEAVAVCSDIVKAIAILGGQWPHTSYAIVGGVSCDPTLMELSYFESYLDMALKFFEQHIIGMSLENYLSIDSIENVKGSMSDLCEIVSQNSLEYLGKAFDRMLVVSPILQFSPGAYIDGISKPFEHQKISEADRYTFSVEHKKRKQEYSWSKSALYDLSYFETGPMARMVIQKRAPIYRVYKTFGDSFYVRALSRLDEVAYLLLYLKGLIKEIDIKEPSFIQPKIKLKQIESTKGVGLTEASRGALVHEVSLEKGIIKKYNIITPTVWNLGPGSKQNPSTFQKSILGVKSFAQANIILRSFDVCSVCTTH
jgi:hydrogenase large subunit